jgi:altronate dehydratase
MRRVVLVNRKDNVVTAVSNIQEGETIELEEASKRIVVKKAVPFGHKIAIEKIANGKCVIKYGECIAKAKEDIEEGDWVHSSSTDPRGAPNNIEEVYVPPEE